MNESEKLKRLQEISLSLSGISALLRQGTVNVSISDDDFYAIGTLLQFLVKEFDQVLNS